MKERNPLYNAVHFALAAGLASFGSTAIAQDQDEDKAELDRIEVTGSRIKRADIESASPVFVIQREEIERTGLTSVGDLLQDLPIAGSALNSQFNNGGNGETNLDLRNLGSNRLLVLLNGRRYTTGLGGAVDLNNIPVAVIKRIEILKDGASSIYGSDAISGVVNIITRDDFEGMQANAQVGQFEGENDGEIQAYDFSIGATSDRGSVFFNAAYTQQQPVQAGDRTISFEPQFGTGVSFGSSSTPQGRFFGGFSGFGFITTDPGTVVDGPEDFRPFTFANDGFNFAPDNYLVTPYERTSIFSQATYDVTDDIRLTAEVGYNKQLNRRELAPMPLVTGGSGFFGPGDPSTLSVGALNPFNPFGVELDSSALLFQRRMVEAGRRFTERDIDSYRFGVGLEGSFEVADRYLDWDVNYVYGQIDRSDIVGGRFNLQRLAVALSDDCLTTPGCVPFNYFGGPGTISQDMIDYTIFEGHDERESRLRNYTANLTGELLEMPAGPLGFAVGYEYRQTEGFDRPDALTTLGITTGNARLPTAGSYAVNEFYVEFAVPILSGVTGAERLDLSLSSRHSDYDTFGTTTNSKIGIEWQPIDDLLLRATFSEGFRAPVISELFGGQGDSFPTISDPCSDLLGLFGSTPASGSLISNCSAVGVPTDGSYVQTNPQIRITVGSNPALNPESSESVTFGFVYSPSWLDGLDLTVDYYNIEIDNVVTTIGSQTILNRCVGVGGGNTITSPGAVDQSFCRFITRGGTGNVQDLFNGLVNGSQLEVEGVDFLVSYNFPETDFGFFRVVWDSAYQGKNDFTPAASTTAISNLGFNAGDTAYVRWKSNVDVNWSYGDWEATYGMQYVHASEEACDDDFNDPNFLVQYCTTDTDNDGAVDQRHIGSATYHDAQVSYHLAEYDTRLTFGIRNIWDKGPPLSVQAFANSFNTADYRSPGRYPYVRVTVDF